MDNCNDFFDDDISNLITALNMAVESFENLDASNNALNVKNKLMSDELESHRDPTRVSQHDLLKGISENLKNNSKILDDQFINLQAELKVAVQLNKKYKKDIDAMEERYINEIHTLNEHNLENIKKLKEDFQEKMNEEHAVKIDEIKAQHATEILELKLQQNDRFEEYESDIEKLRAKIFQVSANYDKIKEDHANLKKKFSSINSKSAASNGDDDHDIFTDIGKKIKTSKSHIPPSFKTKIIKLDVVKTANLAENPKKRKLFNPGSEIIFLKGDD